MEDENEKMVHACMRISMREKECGREGEMA
jgi:hypothetical protein